MVRCCQTLIRSLFKDSRYYLMLKNVVYCKDQFVSRRFMCVGVARNFHDVVKDDKLMLEARDYVANHYGSLNISVPFHVAVECLNPQNYPDMNQIILKMFYLENKPNYIFPGVATSKDKTNKLYEMTVNNTNDVFQVDGKLIETKTSILCHLQIPLKFNLNISSLNGLVTIANMESEKIVVQSNSCVLNNIKCGSVYVECCDGDITCPKVLQGNSTLQVKGQGNINTGRLQGTDIKCSTGQGNITATSVYCQNSAFKCNIGNIRLSNCHGNSQISVSSGNLHIDSLEGSLTADVEDGSVDLYVTRSEDVNINCRSGNIDLKVGETIDTSLVMQAASVACDDKLPFNKEEESQKDGLKYLSGYINGKTGKISAVASLGHLNLKQQTWFHSLNL